MQCYLKLTLAFLVMGGCVSAKMTRLNPDERYPAVGPDEVSVYLSMKEVGCNFDNVALIETRSGNNLKEARDIKKAKKKAGQAGADAIILGGFENPSEAAQLTDLFLLPTNPKKKGKMLAVRLKGSRCNEGIAL